ncbi:MerR family transcriptional regulator [Bacillus paralicheniformis]|uniref:MerR family transcriptional regulator n=1 Tax=Bacillus paralicheniformis TaxID=1648923 RepID=UPI000BA62E9A|nr:MerR family transcriptional regulator [Bacillus paralicheniformis]MBR8662868.1 MerR family transcriptional regulator [Bacillus paralicheniformis]MED1713276.1 MerR family transcriptional regulator [Bacillus paralicheniformis]PAC95344.1 MerR family transcriptional regulator [Bacillus paralicheniformis]TWK40978.1 HTH-type transcriptional activator TipA [Bacillus paralicheniformis]
MSNNMLTIGQLAKRTGVSIRTLRYYDKIGLLIPTDYKEGGHRLYSLDELSRLQQIQSLKFIGFSLKDIADLLKSQFIEEQQLSYSISFKKRELIAEQERIHQTIDQLDHMKTIISGYEKVDIKLFSFIIHSILFEEENFNEYSQAKGSIHNFRSSERANLDKEYFSLFMDLKELIANETNPESDEALKFIKQLVDISNRTLLKIDTAEIESTVQYNEPNILNPFTEEERAFLKNAFAYMSKLQE